MLTISTWNTGQELKVSTLIFITRKVAWSWNYLNFYFLWCKIVNKFERQNSVFLCIINKRVVLFLCVFITHRLQRQLHLQSNFVVDSFFEMQLRIYFIYITETKRDCIAFDKFLNSPPIGSILNYPVILLWMFIVAIQKTDSLICKY